MHYRTLVIIDANSTDAAREIVNGLMQKVYQRGRRTRKSQAFHWPDWHVIGGRWSGYLSNLIYWPDEQAYIDEVKKVHGDFWPIVEGQRYEDERRKHLPEHLRFERDEYERNGYEDDVMPINELFQSKLEELAAIPIKQYSEPRVVHATGRGFSLTLPKYRPVHNKTRFVVVLDVHN